jgi:prevent-host-death family protein
MLRRFVCGFRKQSPTQATIFRVNVKPALETISARAADRGLSHVLRRVADGTTRVVIQRHGTPMGVLVSLDDLAQLEQLEADRAADRAGEAYVKSAVDCLRSTGNEGRGKPQGDERDT